MEVPGEDPGVFLGKGAPLRNDILTGDLNKMLQNTSFIRNQQVISGAGGHFLRPPSRSTHPSVDKLKEIFKCYSTLTCVFLERCEKRNKTMDP